MKVPKYARLVENRKCCYPIETIHYDTRLVTLRESTKLNVYNTLSIKDVEFCFDDFTQDEIDTFMGNFKRFRELCNDKFRKEITNEEIDILKRFGKKLMKKFGVYDEKDKCSYIYLNDYGIDCAINYFIDEEFGE